MSRVLLTWEMGRNFGHTALLMPVARALAARGVTVFMALQAPESAAPFLTDHDDIQILAAPHVRPGPMPRGAKPPPVITFADDLRPCGYDKPDTLAALIRCWHALYDLILPDVIVANSSPTAQIAARHTGIETINFGTGYEVPPLTDPMPAFQYWKPVDDALLRAHEKPVFDVINAAMVQLKLPKFRTLAEALGADHEWLTTFPELDQYANRINGDYVGPLFTDDAGTDPVWPTTDTPGPRVFAYIRPAHPLFVPVLQMLARHPVRAMVVAPGISDKLRQDFSRGNVHIQTKPANMKKVLQDCDVVINHASHGTVAGVLLAGKPQFMIPSQIEQLMMARRIVELNAGTMCHPNATAAQLDAAFTALCEEDIFTARARDVARKHAGYSATETAITLADRIFQLIEVDPLPKAAP